MSRGFARVGDQTTGTCSHPSHSPPITVGGKIITGSEDYLINDKRAARIGDTVRTNCGHTGKIVTGDENSIVNDRRQARLGDKVAGDYSAEIITASNDTKDGS
jgi:uncharacterized Zn-binding protein involved in type VI secretion